MDREPFHTFSQLESNIIKNPINLILEYFQKTEMCCTFEYIGSDGPRHCPSFQYQLSILDKQGNFAAILAVRSEHLSASFFVFVIEVIESIVGVGASKSLAKTAAAENFIRRHTVCKDEKKEEEASIW